jgi:hypothetical protein
MAAFSRRYLSRGAARKRNFPDIAAQWLAEGVDTENLRMLAGADNDVPADIRDSWTAILASDSDR